MRLPPTHDTRGMWFCRCGAQLNVFGNCPLETLPLPVRHEPMVPTKKKRPTKKGKP